MSDNNGIKFMGSTKKDLWDAYKEQKAKLEAIQGGPITTTAKATEAKIKGSIASANSMDISAIDGVLSTLVGQITDLKSQYEDIITAIEAKKAELKDVHGIEVSANDLAALAAVKEKLVTDADEKAKDIRDRADTYYNEIIENSSDKKNDLEVSRRRELEVYSYETDRKRSMSNDAVDDALRTKLKSLDTRETELNGREDDLEQREAEVEVLNNKITELENSTAEKVAKSYVDGEDKAKRSAQYASSMAKMGAESKAEIQEGRINSLEEKITDLIAQLDKSNSIIENQVNQISDMAKSALNAQADAATIKKVAEVAAGSK
jgi:hypothetical protein